MEKVLRFEITDLCNQKCDMCWSKDWKHEDMEYSSIQKLIFEYASCYPNGCVVLTSREPLLSPHFKDTVKLTSDLGLTCKLLTNGTLITEDIASFIVQSNINFISVSIHGGEDYHNQLVHFKNSYQRVIEGISLLNRYKNIYHRDDLEIRITTVMNPELLHSIESIVSWCKLLNTSFRLQHFMWHSQDTALENHQILMDKYHYSDTISSSFPSEPSVSSTQALEILNRVKDKAEELGIDFQDYPCLDDDEIEQWYSRKQLSSFQQKKCDHVASSIRVRANGEVSLCQYIDYSMGNIQQDSLEDINLRYQKVIDSLENGEFYPICNHCCHLRVKQKVKQSINGKI